MVARGPVEVVAAGLVLVGRRLGRSESSIGEFARRSVQGRGSRSSVRVEGEWQQKSVICSVWGFTVGVVFVVGGRWERDVI